MIRKEQYGMFENFMQVKGFTEATKRNYKSSLKKFESEFKGNIQKATIDELVTYIASIKSRSACGQMYGALKLFYTNVLKQKRKFPFIPFPEREQRLPHLPEFKKVFEAIEKTSNTKHKLILSILFGTGIRLSEIVALRWIDIRKTNDETNPITLHISGKGKKDRIVPLSKANYDLLIQYCKENNLGCETNKNHFIFGDLKPYSKRSVANVVEAAGNRVGIDFHPHLLRHLCFTYLRDNGVGLETIQELAGHSAPQTTMQYARLNPVKVAMPV